MLINFFSIKHPMAQAMRARTADFDSKKSYDLKVVPAKRGECDEAAIKKLLVAAIPALGEDTFGRELARVLDAKNLTKKDLLKQISNIEKSLSVIEKCEPSWQRYLFRYLAQSKQSIGIAGFANLLVNQPDLVGIIAKTAQACDYGRFTDIISILTNNGLLGFYLKPWKDERWIVQSIALKPAIAVLLTKAKKDPTFWMIMKYESVGAAMISNPDAALKALFETLQNYKRLPPTPGCSLNFGSYTYRMFSDEGGGGGFFKGSQACHRRVFSSLERN